MSFTQADINREVSIERQRCVRILNLDVAAAHPKGARNCIACGYSVERAQAWIERWGNGDQPLTATPVAPAAAAASADDGSSWDALLARSATSPAGNQTDGAVAASWDRAFGAQKEA
jgi:hypothetical protein